MKWFKSNKLKLQDYKEFAKPFNADYNASAWSASGFSSVLSVVILTLLIWSVNLFNSNPMLFFIVIQIPLILLCSYVLYPNQHLRLRFPINWLLTASLASVAFGLQMPGATNLISKSTIGDFTGILFLLISIYWLISAIDWAWKTIKNRDEETSFWNIFSKLLTTWGFCILVLQVLAKFAFPFIQDVSNYSQISKNLLQSFSVVESLSVVKWIFYAIPLGFIILALLIPVMFLMKEREFKAIDQSEVLPNMPQFINSLLIPIRFLLALGLNFSEFLLHTVRIFVDVFIELIDGFVARLTFILFGLVIGPFLLFGGHLLCFYVIYQVNSYLAAWERGRFEIGNNFFADFFVYIWIVIYSVLSLLSYIASASFLGSRYRNETLKKSKLFNSLKDELFTRGVAASNAVMKAFTPISLVFIAAPIARALSTDNLKKLDNLPLYEVLTLVLAILSALIVSKIVTSKST